MDIAFPRIDQNVTNIFDIKRKVKRTRRVMHHPRMGYLSWDQSACKMQGFIYQNILLKHQMMPMQKIERYPNLNTVLMVEDFLKEHRDIPLTITDIRNKLPKQVMHGTLKVILVYLWQSGKIMYGPKGIQWIFSEPEHLKSMLSNALDV